MGYNKNVTKYVTLAREFEATINEDTSHIALTPQELQVSRRTEVNI